MAVLPEKEEDIDWNVDMEVQLFHAMRGHKPVGVNRYFQMALIHEKFSNSINKEISSKQIWSHLDTMYDMAALHDSEILPFPNDQVDFILPTSEFNDLISKKLDELPLSHAVTLKTIKTESSASKTNNVPVAKTSKATPVKVNQSHSSQTPNKITKDLMGAKLSVPLTPISTKINKSEVAVKAETKLPRDPGGISKNKSDSTPIVKVNKSFTPVNLPSSKAARLELPGGSQKNSKSDSSSDSSSKKGNKQDSSSNFKKHKSDIIENVSQKKIKNENEGNFKRLKSEVIAETTNNKKNSKPENSNGTKKQKGDNDGFKKQKGEGDWTKKHKSDGDGTKKQKGDGDGIKKSSDSSGTKSSKSESKTNLSTLSKGIKGEEDSSSSTASAKIPKTLSKGEGSDSSNKRKRQKNDDSQKKTGTPGSMSATKRRRN